MSNPFDVFSLPVLYILTVILLLLAFELGYRLGNVWKKRSPTTTEGAVGGIAGITLGLLGFLLAFVVTLAAARFDTRKGLVMEDAISIRTAALRSELLGESVQSEVTALLAEYVDIRLDVIQTGDLAAAVQRSNELLSQVWAIAAQAGADGGSESGSLFIQSVNDMINVNTERAFMAIYSRLPFTILVAIYIIALLSLVLAGLHSQFQGSRNLVSMVVLVVVLATVFLLIVDLDRPQEGLLVISQQPMIDLQAELHAAQ
jgi:hypothetical protein